MDQLQTEIKGTHHRRDTGKTYQVGGKEVDNRWVVPHSPYLIWKYRCHINVEWVASMKAVKYIYKYIYKGHDRTTMDFATARMKSSSIWMPDMSPSVRCFGVLWPMRCTKSPQMSIV